MDKSILVIDDETMILDAIKIIFEDMGYSVQTTPDPIMGTEEAIAKDFDLILTDLRMPARNGAGFDRGRTGAQAQRSHSRDNGLCQRPVGRAGH